MFFSFKMYFYFKYCFFKTLYFQKIFLEQEKDAFRNLHDCIKQCKIQNKQQLKSDSDSYNKCMKPCVDKKCGETLIEFLIDEINRYSAENGAILEQITESEHCKNIAIYLVNLFNIAQDCLDQCPDSEYTTAKKKKKCAGTCCNKKVIHLVSLPQIKDVNNKAVTGSEFKMDSKGITTIKQPNTLTMILLDAFYFSYRQFPVTLNN